MLFHLMNLNSLPDSHTISEVQMLCKFSKCTGANIQSQDYEKNLSYSLDPPKKWPHYMLCKCIAFLSHISHPQPGTDLITFQGPF